MRLFLRIALGLALIGLLVVLLLPTMLFSSPVKNWILYDVLPEQGIEGDIKSVSVGWLRPTEITDVSFGPAEKRRLLQADEISVNRTLLQAIFSGSDLGELTIRRPRIHIWMDKDSSNLKFERLENSLADLDLGGEEKAIEQEALVSEPTVADDQKFAVTVEDAELYIKTSSMTNESNVFRDLDLRCTIQQDANGRTLLVEPGPVIKRADITPELCEAGLKFIVPVLANATWTRGEFSLDLDACIIDLDEPKNSLISGRFTIHGIEAGARNELIQSIADALAKFRGREGFESVHLADDSVVQFQVRDGLVWHDGVEVGLPRVSDELVVRTSGSVSFDEELDITIDCPLPLHLIASGPVSRALRDKSLELQASGTLKDPQVRLKDEDFALNLLGSIGSELAEEERPIRSLMLGIRDAIRGDSVGQEDLDEASDAATDEVGDELEDVPLETPILDRFRQRLRDRRRGRGLFGRGDE